jgi:hypothetical protein
MISLASSYIHTHTRARNRNEIELKEQISAQSNVPFRSAAAQQTQWVFHQTFCVAKRIKSQKNPHQKPNTL